MDSFTHSTKEIFHTDGFIHLHTHRLRPSKAPFCLGCCCNKIFFSSLVISTGENDFILGRSIIEQYKSRAQLRRLRKEPFVQAKASRTHLRAAAPGNGTGAAAFQGDYAKRHLQITGGGVGGGGERGGWGRWKRNRGNGKHCSLQKQKGSSQQRGQPEESGHRRALPSTGGRGAAGRQRGDGEGWPRQPCSAAPRQVRGAAGNGDGPGGSGTATSIRLTAAAGSSLPATAPLHRALPAAIPHRYAPGAALRSPQPGAGCGPCRSPPSPARAAAARTAPRCESRPLRLCGGRGGCAAPRRSRLCDSLSRQPGPSAPSSTPALR